MPSLSPEALRERLARAPRESIAHLPTPLQPMPRLSAALGGPDLWIKRDDCTGLATGGNKARKLEFLLGEARAQGADGVISFGALQSNHARQTAAAAAQTGLACDLVLVRRVHYSEPAYEGSGNLLLDSLLGARVHVVEDEAEAAQRLRALLDEAAAAGRHIYVVPTGGSSPTGALGYVGCAIELVVQLAALGHSEATLVHATSSAGTQAGLLVGLSALGADIAVHGINTYAKDGVAQRSELRRLCDETARLLDVEPPDDERIHVDHRHLGEDYGLPTPGMYEALALTARCEGILLDPVYSGKAMAGMIAAVRAGALPGDRPAIFLHTGGSAGLFAYRDALSDWLRSHGMESSAASGPDR
jgi:D-cysteine desulfhydrase family pyridoxal phosphate-dependent enzyme